MPTPKIVTLRPDEFDLAIEVAKNRQVESIRSKRQDSLGKKSTWRDGLGTHLFGTVAEIAVAKLLDKYWMASVNQFSGMAADVSYNIEVRHTNMVEPHLRIRDQDPEDRIYVLATGTPPDISIQGWIKGSDAKQMKQHRKDLGNLGKPAFFIPCKELNEMDLLINN